MYCIHNASDSTGAPRPVVNSKGRRRRPATKTLAQVLRCDDELFVDFIAKCLIWDPERRLKPQPAMRHPFLTVGRGNRNNKLASTTPSKSLLSSTSSSFSGSSRSTNKLAETPKKSQIGAPTPLTARGTRAPTVTVPQTPVGSSSLHSLGPRYRSSVSSHHSSRYAVSLSSLLLGNYFVPKIRVVDGHSHQVTVVQLFSLSYTLHLSSTIDVSKYPKAGLQIPSHESHPPCYSHFPFPGAIP